MSTIGIIDYRMGNLASLRNSLAKLGHTATIVTTPEGIAQSDRLILPGVGGFGDAAAHLRENGLDEAITHFAKCGKPLFGVCLGMQLLFDGSEEAEGARGLGLIPGRVVRFDKAKAAHPIKIPHMGWNETRTEPHPLFTDIPSPAYLYYVHGYHAWCEARYVIARCFYGYDFPAAVALDNVVGLQPHPEKSHDTGLAILDNFIKRM